WEGVGGGGGRALRAGHSRLPAQVAFSPDGETVAGGGEEGTVNQWDVKTGDQRKTLRWHGGPVGAVAFSPDGRWLASGGVDRTVQLVASAAGERRRPLPVEKPVLGLAFSPDSQTLAAVNAAPPPSLRLWDLATRKPRTFPVNQDTGHTQHVVGIAFHPAGNRVITGSLD